jgi:hypothetical protein
MCASDCGLEQYVQHEVAALGDRLTAEQNERVDADKDLGGQLRDTGKSFEKKTAAMDDQSARATARHRQQLLEASSTRLQPTNPAAASGAPFLFLFFFFFSCAGPRIGEPEGTEKAESRGARTRSLPRWRSALSNGFRFAHRRWSDAHHDRLRNDLEHPPGGGLLVLDRA